MRTSAVLLLLYLPLSALSAQQPGPGGTGGYGGGTRRGPERRSPSGNPVADRALASTEPATPTVDVISESLTLDSLQRIRYSAEWDSLDQATRPLRDGLAVQDSIVRVALAQGYQDAVKSHVDMINRLSKSIHQQNEAFSHGLRAFLSKDQVKLYERYSDEHKERLQAAPERRRY